MSRYFHKLATNAVLPPSVPQAPGAPNSSVTPVGYAGARAPTLRAPSVKPPKPASTVKQPKLPSVKPPRPAVRVPKIATTDRNSIMSLTKIAYISGVMHALHNSGLIQYQSAAHLEKHAQAYPYYEKRANEMGFGPEQAMSQEEMLAAILEILQHMQMEEQGMPMGDEEAMMAAQGMPMGDEEAMMAAQGMPAEGGAPVPAPAGPAEAAPPKTTPPKKDKPSDKGDGAADEAEAPKAENAESKEAMVGRAAQGAMQMVKNNPGKTVAAVGAGLAGAGATAKHVKNKREEQARPVNRFKSLVNKVTG